MIFYFILTSASALSMVMDKKSMFYMSVLFGLILFSSEELSMMSNVMSMTNLVWDSSSYWLGVMMLLITLLSLLSNFDDSGKTGESKLCLLMMINLIIMFMLLKSFSMISFYIMFEVGALPIFFIIMGWGNQPEKLKASFFIFFFTMVSSAPLLASIIFMHNTGMSLTMASSNTASTGISMFSEWVAMMAIMGMMAKMPMFGLHNWLPKAHVEAPVYGSMILAGILLKLGGLGAVRLWSLISSNNIPMMVAATSLLGMTAISLVVLTKTDMKQIVAFSSIIHMAIPIILLSISTETSLYVMLLCLISHAFSSSAMFFLVYFFYVASGSRNVMIMKGTAHLYTPMKVLWAGVIVASLGGPPFFNLLVEMLSMQLLFLSFSLLAIVIVLPGVLTCVYHIVLYASVSQGSLSESVHIPRPVSSPSYYGVTVIHLAAALMASLAMMVIVQ